MEIIGGTWGPSKISFGHSFFGGKLKSINIDNSVSQSKSGQPLAGPPPSKAS